MYHNLYVEGEKSTMSLGETLNLSACIIIESVRLTRPSLSVTNWPVVEESDMKHGAGM